MSRHQTRSALFAPRLSLAACVRAHVTRSTLGAGLAAHERFNHFPATPACTITWFIAGSAEWAHRPMPPGRIIFTGPKTGPLTSVNAGDVHTLTVLLMPDALRALTGIEAAAHVDRSSAAGEVFDGDWLAMLHAALDAPDDRSRIRGIEDFIEPRWRAVRGDTWGLSSTYRSWAEALALRAALSGAGRSARQAERRVRRWAGLPMRTLLGLSRTEQALFDLHAAHDRGCVNWADIAHDAGFSDQSHLCREARRVTGASPQQLLGLIDNDESYWLYRLWR